MQIRLSLKKYGLPLNKINLLLLGREYTVAQQELNLMTSCAEKTLLHSIDTKNSELYTCSLAHLPLFDICSAPATGGGITSSLSLSESDLRVRSSQLRSQIFNLLAQLANLQSLKQAIFGSFLSSHLRICVSINLLSS